MELESRYTLFLYEQMRSILDVLDECGISDSGKDALFYGNAVRLLDAKE